MTDNDAMQSRIRAIIPEIEKAAGPYGYRLDEPMKGHTSFRVGGPADIFVTPYDTDVLRGVVTICSDNGIPCQVIGNGTNTIVGDKGFRGVVVKMTEGFGKCTVLADDILEAEAGILLTRLSMIALDHSLAGLEFASGIPGTLGGAIHMNAGAYGGEMKDLVNWTQYIDGNGCIRELSGEEHRFGYRTSFFTENPGIILKSRLRMKTGNQSEIRSLMNELSSRRKANQPLDLPSAGSVFKRVPGHYTWHLIEGCDLRGYTIGGARISDKHCGFIVNTGNATADDVIRLIEYVKMSVMDKYKVELHAEVKVIGER